MPCYKLRPEYYFVQNLLVLFTNGKFYFLLCSVLELLYKELIPLPLVAPLVPSLECGLSKCLIDEEDLSALMTTLFLFQGNENKS